VFRTYGAARFQHQQRVFFRLGFEEAPHGADLHQAGRALFHVLYIVE